MLHVLLLSTRGLVCSFHSIGTVAGRSILPPSYPVAFSSCIHFHRTDHPRSGRGSDFAFHQLIPRLRR